MGITLLADGGWWCVAHILFLFRNFGLQGTIVLLLLLYMENGHAPLHKELTYLYQISIQVRASHSINGDIG
jgi:hypothetical protein